jgi:hypothetical protein
MAQPKGKIETLVIDNFQGLLTRQKNGNLNSGYSKYFTTFGNDAFTDPGNLRWYEQPTRIDPNELIITDLIMAARPRLESGITYVYAIGHTGRFYKIQVNDPTSYSPNFDSPVLLTTLTSNSPTFKYGASIQFFGSTERVFIGHDIGVTRVDFTGANETFVGVAASYTANVPRPSVNFGGVTYWGNGTNLAAIDSTSTVSTYTKLSPAFPVGTTVRDLDVSPDGNYLQIIVTRVPSPDLTSATQDTTSLSSGDSYFIYWNGTDTGYTSYNPFNAYSLNANTSFGPFSYTMGYDLGGAAIYSGGQKIISLPNSIAPTFNGTFSTGNLFGFGAPENDFDTNTLQGTMMFYGKYDLETPDGLYRPFRLSASNSQTDIIQIPVCSIVSNLLYGSSSAGYAQNLVGSAKLYFSTLETSSAPTTKYKLYKFTTVPTGLGSAIAGVYETQTQLFSKKVTLPEIRVYTVPLATGVSFKIELIGSNDDVISGSSQTFTVGSNGVVAGQDMLQYNPQIAPTYAVGVRITNIGTVNWTCRKLEVDYTYAGK